MKHLQLKPFLFLLSLSLILFSCKDDSSSSSSSTAATNSSNVDFTGTYTGAYTYIETDKSTQAKDTTYNPSFSVAMASSGAAAYTMTIPGDASSSLSMATNGKTFTSSNGTGFFAGSSYSGNLEGDMITINEVGEDASSSWVGEILANRPPNTGGGGGGGCNTMSISGYSVGSFNAGGCITEYEASFASDQTDYIWHLSISFDDDCDAGVADGSYTIISDGNQSFPGTDYAVIELDLEHTGNNPDLIQLVSTDQSGTMTVSNTSGGLKVQVSGISLVDASNASNSKTVSFCTEF